MWFVANNTFNKLFRLTPVAKVWICYYNSHYIIRADITSGDKIIFTSTSSYSPTDLAIVMEKVIPNLNAKNGDIKLEETNWQLFMIGSQSSLTLDGSLAPYLSFQEGKLTGSRDLQDVIG